MSITYEEAIETLEAMFGETWSRDQLDTVLRHFQGHMENSVDCILKYNNNMSPAQLIDMLQSGIDPAKQQAELDAQLARSLANSRKSAAPAKNNANTSSPAVATATTTTSSTPSVNPLTGRANRGTPTHLPAEFLRIPGSGGSVATSTPSGQMSEDERLARLLQDEFFSEELRRNPEFAHLGRSNGRVVERARSSQQPAAPGAPPMPSPAQIMGQLRNMGESAKHRLQTLAAQFQNQPPPPRPTPQQPTVTSNPNERRGLLDDGDDEYTYEFASRKDL